MGIQVFKKHKNTQYITPLNIEDLKVLIISNIDVRKLTMNKYVVILDIGVEIYLVLNACKIVGIETIFTDERDLILNSSGMIIPVGSFRSAMEKIKSKNLDQIILDT